MIENHPDLENAPDDGYDYSKGPIDFGICDSCKGNGCWVCQWSGEIPIYPRHQDEEDAQ